MLQSRARERQVNPPGLDLRGTRAHSRAPLWGNGSSPTYPHFFSNLKPYAAIATSDTAPRVFRLRPSVMRTPSATHNARS